MVAVDTNILVRLLTGDDAVQSAAARDLFASELIWISKTVLLETGWVLRSLYGFEETEIREALGRLLGLTNVRVEDAPAISAAMAWNAKGIEWADAMHLASRPAGTKFVSFDKAFVRRAQRSGVSAVERL